MTAVAPRPASRASPASVRGGADRRVATLTPLLASELPAPQRFALRVPAAARAAFLAARRTQVTSSAPMVVVVRNDEEAHRLADDLGAWLPSGRVRVLPQIKHCYSPVLERRFMFDAERSQADPYGSAPIVRHNFAACPRGDRSPCG